VLQEYETIGYNESLGEVNDQFVKDDFVIVKIEHGIGDENCGNCAIKCIAEVLNLANRQNSYQNYRDQYSNLIERNNDVQNMLLDLYEIEDEESEDFINGYSEYVRTPGNKLTLHDLKVLSSTYNLNIHIFQEIGLNKIKLIGRVLEEKIKTDFNEKLRKEIYILYSLQNDQEHFDVLLRPPFKDIKKVKQQNDETSNL